MQKTPGSWRESKSRDDRTDRTGNWLQGIDYFSLDDFFHSVPNKGYLTYCDGLSVGWCNANDRLSYFRVGEFDTDDIPEDTAPTDCPGMGIIKSVVCFEIAPAYRGKGIAGKLLERVCEDAAKEGFSFVEAYPKDQHQDSSLAFTGPLRLYEKAGFREYCRNGSTIIMRKRLKPQDEVS